MVSKKTRRHGNGGFQGGKENDEGSAADYEQFREQRIKENQQRMQKLGIFELSRNLKPPSKPKPARPPPKPSSSASLRRSSRLKTMPTVSYAKSTIRKEILMDVKPEVYTEEHEKMLGDHNETWRVFVDGYYVVRKDNAFEPCHQCRRKIAGIHTKCCKCKTLKRPFCGNCLFISLKCSCRYGENVVEANANPDWVCPICRDICNCSCCRRAKGWKPIGNFSNKALHLGFKSIAHYLIHTRGPRGKQEDGDKDESNKDDEHSKHASTDENIKRHDLDQCKGEVDVDLVYESDRHDDDDDDSNEDD